MIVANTPEHIKKPSIFNSSTTRWIRLARNHDEKSALLATR